MQSSELNLLTDPSLLFLLQSLQVTANPTFSQGKNQPSQQEQSLESMLQQVNIFQVLQEFAGLQPQQQQANQDDRIQPEEQKQQQKGEEQKVDQNTLSQEKQQQFINRNAVSENIIQQAIHSDNKEQQKRETTSILGVDPSLTAETSLCQEFLNSLVTTAAGSGKAESIVSLNNQLQPCNSTTLPFNKTSNSQLGNTSQETVSSEMQLFNLLQSCLTFDQIMQAAAGNAVSSSNENSNKEMKNYETLLGQQKNSHLLQTPTSSYQNGFKSPNETTTNNTRFSASNSKINNGCSTDFNILSSVNANLSAYFNMSATATATADNKLPSLSQSPPSIQSAFAPTVLSQNFQLQGFESLDSLAAAQLSLQALLASGFNNKPEILRLQEQKRLERQFKIERYKNKRRNWIRKISYDCRKRVADSRLRVKGRFISKKDTQTAKPNCPEDSSFQTDNYAQNSTFSDVPKQQNTHPNTPNHLISSNLLLNPLNTNISNKSNQTYNLTSAASFQRLPLLSPASMDKIKQRIKDKKQIFALKFSKQALSTKDNNTFFPMKFPCFVYAEDQAQSSNNNIQPALSNQESQQGVSA